MMRKLLLLAVITLYTVAAAAAQGHILYTGDPLPSKSKEMIGQMVEHMFDFYGKIGIKEIFTVELKTFKDKGEGYRYMREIYPDNPNYKVKVKSKTYGGTIGGVYIPDKKQAVILGMEKGVAEALPMIYHELSHHFTRMIFEKRNPPIWLNEGLSEYFQSLKKTKKGYVAVFPAYIKGKVKTMHMLGELDLENFFNLSQSEFYKIHREEGQYYYGLSHAVVATLMQNVGAGKIKSLVLKIKSRDTSQKVSDFVDELYPGGIKGLEEDLIRFVNE